MSNVEKASVTAKRALGVLRAFAKAFKVKVGDVEFVVDAAKGTANSGNLEADLPELLLTVAAAARSGHRHRQGRPGQAPWRRRT